MLRYMVLLHSNNMDVRTSKNSALSPERYGFASGCGCGSSTLAALHVSVGGKFHGYIDNCIIARPGVLNWFDSGLWLSWSRSSVVCLSNSYYVGLNALNGGQKRLRPVVVAVVYLTV